MQELMVYTSVNYMKSIAIVGAGIAGLRAGLELSKIHKVTLYEKSPSVGGRVASRRFGSAVVNHGAANFDGMDYLENDSLAEKFRSEFDFTEAATKLPKAMRDMLLESPNLSVHFNSKISSISYQCELKNESGLENSYDAVIITAPIPQVRELLGIQILPGIYYSKQILFIGTENDMPVRLELPGEFSEDFFEEEEELIRKRAEDLFSYSLSGLFLKKWRYSRVLNGSKNYFYQHNPKIIIAGDAFDPGGHHHLGASWISGLMAARNFL